jgi:hypothetical protein
MKRPLITLVFFILLMLASTIASAEPPSFKKPGDYGPIPIVVGREIGESYKVYYK